MGRKFSLAQKEAELDAALARKDAELAAALAQKDAAIEAAIAGAVAAAIAETEARMERERRDDLRGAIHLLNQRGMYVRAYKLSCSLSRSATELVSLVAQVERSFRRARACARRSLLPAKPAEAV